MVKKKAKNEAKNGVEDKEYFGGDYPLRVCKPKFNKYDHGKIGIDSKYGYK